MFGQRWGKGSGGGYKKRRGLVGIENPSPLPLHHAVGEAKPTQSKHSLSLPPPPPHLDVLVDLGVEEDEEDEGDDVEDEEPQAVVVVEGVVWVSPQVGHLEVGPAGEEEGEDGNESNGRELRQCRYRYIRWPAYGSASKHHYVGVCLLLPWIAFLLLLLSRGLSLTPCPKVTVFFLVVERECTTVCAHMGTTKISAGGERFFPQRGGLQKMT